MAKMPAVRGDGMRGKKDLLYAFRFMLFRLTHNLNLMPSIVIIFYNAICIIN